MPIWTASLAIGVPDIDEQHRRLFERADSLLGAMKRGKPSEEVRKLIGFLEDYCAHHFQTEEDLMREKGIPALQDHAREHALFRERFQEIVTRFLGSGPSLSVTLDLQELIGKWLVHHVRSSDLVLRVTALPRSTAGSRASGAAPEARPGRGPLEPLSAAGAEAPAGIERGREFELVFRECEGKRILQLDFTGLPPARLLEALRVAGKAIRSAPPRSLRILTLLNSSLSADIAVAFKDYARRNRPHVLASAVVGTSFWNVIVTDVLLHGREDITLFESEAQALSWLLSA